MFRWFTRNKKVTLPPLAPNNPGVGTSLRVKFSNTQRSWTEDADIIGMLAELLGPTIDLQAKAVNVSAGGGDAKSAAGSLQVKAKSPRASAEINGDVRGGAFVQTGVVNVKLTQITPQMIKMLGADVIPLVTSVEKTPQDQPGTFDGQKLTIPIDDDLSKLNGDMTIDPGVVRFTTQDSR